MKYLLATFLGAATSLAALPVGNPAEPQIIDQGLWISQETLVGVKIGYEGDVVFDRKLKANSHAHGKIDQMRLFSNQGVLTFNYLDRLEFYGSAGTIEGKLSHRPDRDDKKRRYPTKDGFVAGCGGRLLLAQWGKIIIGIDGKIEWAYPDIKKMTVDGVSFHTKGHLKYCEWQASFAVSYTADWFTPYLGIKYSNVHANVSGIPHTVYSSSHFKMINRDRFGIGLGFTLTSGKDFDLFVETQLIDESSLSFGGNLRF